LRIPILLASAAALALAGCGAPGNEAGKEAEAETIRWDRGLEQQLLAALDGAPSHGLTRDLFLKGELPSGDADRNRALTRIALDYASALARGKTDPAKLYDVYTLPRPTVDVAAGLRQAMADGKLGEWLDTLAPQTDEYRTLGQAFVALVQQPPGQPTPGSPDSRERARQLAVAMERLRWLERNPPATRIDVNIAATLLDYWRDGQHQGQRRVVAGQPGWETPQLGSPIFQLVANPSWNVPKSIEEEELSKKPASYFREQNIVRKNGRYVQLPGPKNALGEVKFDMKNDHAIYLHDTPAKALFAKAERHESHGCVRVDGALDFARELALADGVLEDFEEALASGEETFVSLKTQIPVRLMYQTAFLGPDGRIRLAEDVYGWDNDVAAALGYEARQRPRVEPRPRDIGP
jgi:murein L,D-transpeptidase YcbB/YkuD